MKSPHRIRLFREKCPTFALPPEPVPTRWGTWLAAASYYAEHSVYDLPVDAISINVAQSALRITNLPTDLLTIENNFEFLLVVLKVLQMATYDLIETRKTIEEIDRKFEALSSKYLIM